MDLIRNFSIIAHIDHGKSTLADRIIERTQALTERKMRSQVLDSMDLERERGITIKSQAATLVFDHPNKKSYTLNLIDTPGHVDFSYEVSRALAACEGVLLVVDATQGVEAQTLANLYQALEHNLEIIPVINKIDLPSADIQRCRDQITQETGLDGSTAIPISAKNGIGIDDLLEGIVERIPAPKGVPGDPLQALVFDSFFDAYRGIVISVRIFNGELHPGHIIRFLQSKQDYEVQEVGIHQVIKIPKKRLLTGEVGYVVANVREISEARVGDTLTLSENPTKTALPGYREVHPMVYAGIYPISQDEFPLLREAIEKLKLNDGSLIFEPEKSLALGFGFRCGFLGLLHLEIVQERLFREYGMVTLTTLPSVPYLVKMSDGTERIVHNPAEYPDPSSILEAFEPFALVSMIVPSSDIGPVMTLCHDRRGIQKAIRYLDKKRAQVDYELPLAEIVYDFHDRIKSATRGYASYEYELLDQRPSALVKLDILVNSDRVDAFSQIMHESRSQERGREVLSRLKETIPRHLFRIPLQAAIGRSIIARLDISAMRKDVTAKCYGGDISRKRKLLEKQKEGKKRMRRFGKVDIPQEAFLKILKTTE